MQISLDQIVLVLEPSKNKSDIKIKQQRTKTVTTSSYKWLVFQKVHLVTWIKAESSLRTNQIFTPTSVRFSVANKAWMHSFKNFLSFFLIYLNKFIYPVRWSTPHPSLICYHTLVQVEAHQTV